MLLKKDDICCPCVYLLKKDGVVVYVGSSEYGLSRCLSHKDRIDFNEIDFQPCELRQMHNLEAENIVKYKTQRNIVLPANEVYMTLNMIKRYINSYGLIAIRDRRYILKAFAERGVKPSWGEHYHINDVKFLWEQFEQYPNCLGGVK